MEIVFFWGEGGFLGFFYHIPYTQTGLDMGERDLKITDDYTNQSPVSNPTPLGNLEIATLVTSYKKYIYY